jgi:ketosteroid isomerase-like protein
MSQQDVELVRLMVQEFNSADQRGALARFHPEMEFTSTANRLDGAAYVGIEGMGRYADDLEAAFEEWHSEDDRFVDAGEGRVVWLHRIVGVARTSRFAVDQPIGIVWTVRDGLIWRGRAHLSHAEALASVGLEE